MKNVDEVRKRLEKLRTRYLRQHCSTVRAKKPQNCVHNVLHTPRPQKKQVLTEVERAPRVVTTLVIMRPESPVRLCMYGSENSATWNGDLCDGDAVAQNCPYFEAKLSEEQAAIEFEELMADDEHVVKHYGDVAALQWVLGERVYRVPLSAWGRFLLWIDGFMRNTMRPVPRLSKSDRGHLLDPGPPEELWQDADAENFGKRSP